METTLDQFINHDPREKELFEQEYADFLVSEFVLEKMEQEKVSTSALARRAGVSPLIIRQIKNKKAEQITYRTFAHVLRTLGHRLRIEKI
jgi:DNA-binding Xre family transcriptional regulator